MAEDNGTSERYVIEIERGWQFMSGEFKDFYLARIFAVPTDPRWPTRRQKPVIVLAAKESTPEAAAEQVRAWFAMGAPTQEEARVAVLEATKQEDGA